MCPILSLHHHRWCPMHLSKNNYACACECDSLSSSSDGKNCCLTFGICLEFFDSLMAFDGSNLSINPYIINFSFVHHFLNPIQHCLMVPKNQKFRPSLNHVLQEPTCALYFSLSCQRIALHHIRHQFRPCFLIKFYCIVKELIDYIIPYIVGLCFH